MIKNEQSEPRGKMSPIIFVAIFMLLGIITIFFGFENRLWFIVGLVITLVSVIVGIVLIVTRKSEDTMKT